MIRIHIIAVGKDKDEWVTEGVAHFEKLLSRFAKIKWTIVTAPSKSSSLSLPEIKLQEAKLIQKYLGGGTIITLADTGRQYDSPKFAKRLETLLSHCSGESVFVIGGPYGLDKSILEQADEIVSLSGLTFSHQIVRLILLEQLYRAFTILKGTDYHK